MSHRDLRRAGLVLMGDNDLHGCWRSASGRDLRMPGEPEPLMAAWQPGIDVVEAMQ